MRTFNQYMEYENLRPMIRRAAELMVELNIDPEEYLVSLKENSFAPGLNNFGSGISQVGSGLGNMGQGAVQMGAGAVSSAWDKGSQAANAAGQGAKSWWQYFNSADRKLSRAANLITKAMSDPHVSQQPNAHQVLSQMVAQLTQMAHQAKQSRTTAAAPAAAPGATAGSGTMGAAPSPGATGTVNP